jgi:hypothetical protein
VKIDGHVCGLGAVKHREFAMAAGEMTEAEFTGFLSAVFANLAAHSADGAISFIAWTGATSARFWPPQRASSPNSKTSAFGRRATAAWARSTARNT